MFHSLFPKGECFCFLLEDKMIFKTLVECILKNDHDPDDRLAINALSTLTQEIQRDLTQAFVLSRPLVDLHPTVFWESRSFLDFLMKIAKLPSLRDISDPAVETPVASSSSNLSDAQRDRLLKLESEHTRWTRERSALQKQRDDLQRQSDDLQKQNDDFKRLFDDLKRQLETCRSELQNAHRFSESLRCPTWQDEKACLEEQLATCREKLENTSPAVTDDLRSRLFQLQSELNERIQENEGLKQQLAEHEKRSNSLLCETFCTQTEHADYDALKSKECQWNAEKAELEQELAQCRKQLDEWKGQLATCHQDLQNKESFQRSTWKDLNGKLEEANRQLQEVNQRAISLEEAHRTSERVREEKQQEWERMQCEQQRLFREKEDAFSGLMHTLSESQNYIDSMHAYMQRFHEENWNLHQWIQSLKTEIERGKEKEALLLDDRTQILSLGSRLWKEYKNLLDLFTSRKEMYQTLSSQSEKLKKAGVTITQDFEWQGDATCFSLPEEPSDDDCGTVLNASVCPDDGPLLNTLRKQFGQIQFLHGTIEAHQLADYVRKLHQDVAACREDMLKAIAEAASLESVTFDGIVESLKKWESLREMMCPDITEPLTHIKKCIKIYSTIANTVPHLQSDATAWLLADTFQKLRNLLRSQNMEKLDIEEENWFETFLNSYVTPMLEFITKLEKMEPTIVVSHKTEEWYEAFKSKFYSLKSERASIDKRKRSDEEIQSGNVTKKLQTDTTYCKHVNHLEMVRLENLFFKLYQEHFKLKLKHYRDASWTPDEKQNIQKKLIFLSEVTPTRPSSIIKIYEKYIEFDLKTAIGNLKPIQDILESDELLVKCLENTNKHLEDLLKGNCQSLPLVA